MVLSLLIFLVVIFNSLAQLSMKASALYSTDIDIFGVLNLWFIVAIVCLAISFLCWHAALRMKPISFLHPFASLVYILVPALSAFIFNDTISLKYIVGICCIISGVCITSMNVCQTKNKY